MLKGTEGWVSTSQQGHEIGVAKMRVLHWMTKHTRKLKMESKSGTIKEDQ